MNRCDRNKNRRESGKKYAVICSVALLHLLVLTACANGDPQTGAALEGQVNQDAGNDAVQSADSPMNQNVGNENAQDAGKAGPDAAAQGTGDQTDIGLEQAKNEALSHAGLEASAVTFTKEKQDYDDGVAEYKIEFVTADKKYEYEVRASDGEILDASVEAVEQVGSNAGAQGSVTLEEAKTIALNHAGLDAGQVSYTKLEQDYDDGQTEYEIEFYADGKEYSYTIHGETGNILEVETEMR